MPDTYAVEPRSVTGKAVKKLRREGVIPANIYGRGIESTVVQLPFADARSMLNHHGRNVLIEVHVQGEAKARPVVIRDVEREPVSGALQHIDFYQVDLERAIQGEVSVVLIGEAPVVGEHGGVLMHQSERISVEALPSDMPEHIEVSVDGLTDFDQSITVADLVAPSGVTILADPDTVVVAVARPRLVEEEEVAEEAAAEGEEEAAETPQQAQAEEAAEAAAEAAEERG
jgi:large subunit ribosomal protein L25